MTGQNLKIVVAEADAAIRHSLLFALRSEGYAPEVFETGEELLAHAGSFDAAAYILDHHLPDMSGPELLSRLRKGHAAAPAMFLTGHASAALRRAAQELDAQILMKPLIGNALTLAVEELLARSGGKTSPRDLDQGGEGPAAE